MVKKSSKFLKTKGVSAGSKGQKKSVKEDLATSDTPTEKRSLIQLNQDLNDAIAAKCGPYLQPGESLSIEVTRSDEVVSASILMEGDESASRLEIEAARLVDDQEGAALEGDPDEWLDVVIDYVDVALEDYFANDRFMRHNDDWRFDEYFGHVIRYRSSFSRPSLDALADAWLEKGGLEPNETPQEIESSETSDHEVSSETSDET